MAVRKDVLVIGTGNPLREDDGIGIELVERLAKRFGDSLETIVMLEPDITVSEKISHYSEIFIVDALSFEIDAPYKTIELIPSGHTTPHVGFTTHVFDWGAILTISRDIFGHCPKATLVGVKAERFSISERVSKECLASAEVAFEFLAGYIDGKGDASPH